MQVTQQGVAGLAIVQVGNGNTVAPIAGQLMPGLIIQNTANNRVLQSLTVIDAVTNSMGLLQARNFQQTISDALRGGLGR